MSAVAICRNDIRYPQKSFARVLINFTVAVSALSAALRGTERGAAIRISDL